MKQAALALLLLAGCSKPPSSPTTPWFRDIAEESGLRFTHVNGATGHFYMPEIMGAGAALLDYDADGDLDVFLVQGASFDGTGPGNRLFRNELVPSGRLQFADVTVQAGLAHSAYGMGAATGDFDRDGRVDLLVTNFGSNVLYRNRGDGTFENVTSQSPGIALPGRWSTSASFFDYDRDGWQDLAILNYVDFAVNRNKRCSASTGEPDYCTPVAYRALPAHLFHNDHGRFREVTEQAGLNKAAGPGLGSAALDLNSDGWPDLFVANDTAANHLWINQKNGTFLERGLPHGVAFSDEGVAKAGMGVAAGDYDNDGDDDLLVLNLMREGATLFQNTGNGNFQDASLKTGIHALTYAYTGFGTGWLDFDNDGWLDTFLSNGAVTLREEQRGKPFPFLERNLLLRNPGSGRFLDVTNQAGPALELMEVTRGAAFGDIDNDGDIDILLTNNNGPVRLLRNDVAKGNWAMLRLDGPALAMGAKVGLKVKGQPMQWRRVHTDSSYLTASDPRVHFGLGTATEIESATVHTVAGKIFELRDVKPGVIRRVEVP